MAQRMRVRPGRVVWVGAWAVVCGGLTGCFSPEKDTKISPPPQAKGYQTTTGVYGPNGQKVATGGTNPGGANYNSPYSTAGAQPGAGNLTSTPGNYPPGYTPAGRGYDPTAGANPNNPGAINTPTRPTSAGQFNSSPSGTPLVPSVAPAGNSYAPPSTPSYSPTSGGTPYSSAGSTTGYQRADPTPPAMSELSPMPPSPPSPNLAPSVAPYNPPGTPTPTMSAPLSPAGGYPRQ